MQTHQKLDEIFKFLESARSLPMSSSVVVNRNELNELLEELRDALPAELLAAQDVLRKQDTLLYETTSNAERLLEAAAEEGRRLVSEEEVVRNARIEAAEMLQAARDETDRMSRDIDGYVDAKLAHLEVSVSNILEAIRQGREHLSASTGLYGELAADDTAVPRELSEPSEAPRELADRPNDLPPVDRAPVDRAPVDRAPVDRAPVDRAEVDRPMPASPSPPAPAAAPPTPTTQQAAPTAAAPASPSPAPQPESVAEAPPTAGPPGAGPPAAGPPAAGPPTVELPAVTAELLSAAPHRTAPSDPPRSESTSSSSRPSEVAGHPDGLRRPGEPGSGANGRGWTPAAPLLPLVDNQPVEHGAEHRGMHKASNPSNGTSSEPADVNVEIEPDA